MVSCALVTTLEQFGENALALTNDLLTTEGSLRYFTDWDEAITKEFERRRIADMDRPITFQATAGPWRKELRPVRVSGGKSHRVNYALLKRQRPDLYSAYVRETPPATPVKLTFKSATKLRGGSRVWDDIRSRGWVKTDAVWAPKRATPAVYSAADQAKVLMEVRERAASLKERRAALRVELAAILVPDPEAGLDSVRYGDGMILPGLNPPSRTLINEAARSHPVVRQFVTETTRKDYIRWAFVECDDDQDQTPEDWAKRWEGE